MLISQPTHAANTPIQAGNFWPAIDPVEARAAMRLDGTVTDIRLRHALIEAIASVADELADWRRAQQAKGWHQLQAIEAETVDGESVLVLRWRRAIHASAGADLAERYRSFDSSGSGKARADELDLTADSLRAMARLAIRSLLGRPAITVALI